MDVRMLPIRHVFERFPRMVRDLARQTGKDIELILEGENTRIDKAIIDEIGEPLVHLDPQQRGPRHRGPGRAGGRGQDAHRDHPALRGPGVEPRRDHDHGRRGRHRRRATSDEGASPGGSSRATRPLTERDVVQLIFSQGFSTREAVTEVSGRGVGPGRGAEVHRAAERPGGGGDGARGGHQVHHPAPPHPRHHLRPAGRGRRAHLRRPALPAVVEA